MNMSISKWSARFGPCRTVVDRTVRKLMANRVPARLWEKDHTLWKPSPAEITNRLGWLESPQAMLGNLSRIKALVDAVRADGYTQALLLGMGGSSLAPEVFRKTFGVADGYLDLTVLDSTDPGAVLAFTKTLDLSKALFIVSTKSGGTVETLSFLKYFFHRAVEQLGEKEAVRHFVAITDPGSALADLVAAHHFRATFLNDPDIGGRYSALSYFGLVPAALLGVDVKMLLDRAVVAAGRERSLGPADADDLSGLYLGSVMGALARAGWDKLTFVFSPSLVSIGDWLEQLIAESTGKEGKGILPVVGEPLGRPDDYGDDRLFVCLYLEGEDRDEDRIKILEEAGRPVVRISLQDRYDLGGQIFLWEVATAVAGHILEINPFDQPDVEAAKILTRKMIARYQEKRALPVEIPALTGDGIAVYGDIQAHSPGDALNVFLGAALPKSYVALQAYIQPTTDTDKALLWLRTRLRDQLKLATTVGYGPRYLHSTGQFHKGDGNQGFFIQFTADDRQDAPIPDDMGPSASLITFGMLKAAQALGDRQALLDAGRPILRFHFGRDVVGGLKILTEAIS
jgi:glucose-6-phosphate isomerase